MYLGFWRPVALKPAPLLGVGRKCALELSNSGQYLNLNYVMPIASNSLTFDFNGYNTKYDVTDNKNRIWSLASTYATGPHAFTLAYQRSS